MLCTDDIPRVRVVLKVGMNNGRGAKGLLEQLKKAATDVYHAKSFSPDEYDLGTLFLRSSGNSVSSLASRALGLPSPETIRRRSHVPTIRISHGYPTLDEIIHNIDIMYPVAIPAPKHGLRVGYVLMVDEVKVEERMSWCPDTNCMAGSCREHSKPYDLTFRSMAQPLALAQGFRQDKVHLSKEVRIPDLFRCCVAEYIHR